MTEPKTIHVSAGTQVVVATEARGTNAMPVHPRGAVGIIARTPAGTEAHYLIRFPDGFETSFTRDQFEILKHFKDRLAGPANGGNEFELESCIIYRCVVGSRAYGLDTYASDTDFRGVYLAPLDMHLSLFGAPEQFEDNGAQTCYWELQKFLVMALKANPNILECLYSPLVEKVTPIGERLALNHGRSCHREARGAQFRRQVRPRFDHFSQLFELLCAQVCVAGFSEFGNGELHAGLEKSDYWFKSSPCTQFKALPLLGRAFCFYDLCDPCCRRPDHRHFSIS